MTTSNVSSGVTSSGVTVGPNDVLNVLSGGTASRTIDNGVENVYGNANATTISSGGQEFVYSGGTTSLTAVDNGGQETAYAQGIISGATVNNGGTANVSSGGITDGTTLNNGATEIVSAGGSATDTTVNNGGTENISSGATASNTTVNNGGTEVVYVGGSSVDLTLNAGGNVVIGGGTVIDTVVNSGGTEYVSSGTASGTTVNGGGIEYVYAGGVAAHTVVLSGGQERVSAGGVATDVTVSSGGAVYLSSGGTGSGTVVTGSGALDVVYSGATVTDTTISGGGTQIVSSGGVTSFTLVNSGGTEIVSAGGVGSRSVVNGDGREVVSAGGVARVANVYNGGSATVLSGGTAIGISVYNGGNEIVSSGGTTTGGTVGNGGIETVYTGGKAVNTTVSRGGEYVSSGGLATGTTVINGGIVTVDTGGVASGGQVNSGGTEFVYSGGLTSSTTIGGSGTLDLAIGGTASGGILFNGANAALIVEGSALPTTTLSGFAATDTIDLSAVGFDSAGSATVDPGTDILTVTEGGASHTLQLAGDYTGDYFHTTADNGGGTIITEDTTPPCFCAGTRILTPKGMVAVEKLCVGDRVNTLSQDARSRGQISRDGSRVSVADVSATRSIKWIGWRRLALAHHAEPELVRPIRILRNAIAENVPSRDLLLSPDHAVFIDGMLIPARLLRNGATIFEDHDCHSVTYFHVELDAHDVLLAEGMPAESYLDTGNRATFENAGVPVILHPDFGDTSHQARREAASCAPLVSDATRVKPVWHSLARRAELLGFSLQFVETTTDPALCIAVGGKRFTPVSCEGNKFTFFLPKVTGEARLVSRSIAPSVLQPWVEDRRNMGVMVRQLVVQTASDYMVIAADDPRLANGWWASESDSAATWRWTNGNAGLPIAGSSVLIEVLVGDTQTYGLTEPDRGQQTARSRKLCA